MEAPIGSDIFNKVPDDLLAAEILPWLPYAQLAKVATVSKKLAKITKQIGSFYIDTLHQDWLDPARVLNHVHSARYLSLRSKQFNVLERLANTNQNNIEVLDVQYLKYKHDLLLRAITAVIKNNKNNCLTTLKLPKLNFNQLVRDNVICPSVRSLIIRNSGDDESLIETTDILKVFPSLKRLELRGGPEVDLYKYLCENTETPLEHVSITRYSAQKYPGVIAALKSLDITNSGQTVTLKELNSSLTRLKLGYSTDYSVLPKLENLEWLEIHSDGLGRCALIDNASKLTYLCANPYIITKLKSAQSLKSIETRITDTEFKTEVLAQLPNLESLTLFELYPTFWTMEKGTLTSSLKQLKLECFPNEWNPTMNTLVNLTNFTLSGSSVLAKIPSQFFKSCTKLTHFALENCGVTKISRKLRHLKGLEVFKVKSCKLTEIPSALKDLPNLQSIDLRGNPFTLESVPVTLPVKTVVFRDREWIQLIQRYLVALQEAKKKAPAGTVENTQSFFEKLPAPTVAQMMRMPYLSTNFELKSGILARVLLHAFKVKGAELEEDDNDSDYLAGALMRRTKHRVKYDSDDDDSDEDEKIFRQDTVYDDKATTVGKILFNEWNSRKNGKLMLVRVETTKDSITTYSLEASDASKHDGGWSSRMVWKLQGYVHEFKHLKVTEKESKYIRNVVEPK